MQGSKQVNDWINKYITHYAKWKTNNQKETSVYKKITIYPSTTYEYIILFTGCSVSNTWVTENYLIHSLLLMNYSITAWRCNYHKLNTRKMYFWSTISGKIPQVRVWIRFLKCVLWVSRTWGILPLTVLQKYIFLVLSLW